jgi:hypothetical protein
VKGNGSGREKVWEAKVASVGRTTNVLPSVLMQLVSGLKYEKSKRKQIIKFKFICTTKIENLENKLEHCYVHTYYSIISRKFSLGITCAKSMQVAIQVAILSVPS